MRVELNDLLIEAATAGDFSEVQRLVETGADVNYGAVPAYIRIT